MSVPNRDDELPDIQVEEPLCLPPSLIITGSKRRSPSPRDDNKEELHLVPQKIRRLEPKQNDKWCDQCRRLVNCFILRYPNNQCCQSCLGMPSRNMFCTVCRRKDPDLIEFVRCQKCTRISHLSCIEARAENGIAKCKCDFELPIEEWRDKKFAYYK